MRPGRPRSDDRYLHLTRDVSFSPLFIIGDHRSGTTLLHRLLAETGCFNYLSAYQVIRYDDILTHHIGGTTEAEKAALMRTFDELGLKNRIIDEVPATPDAPVEYGFVLAAALNMRRAFLTARSHPTFLELCRKIQYVSDRDKPLVLKNPWDALNFVDIRTRVPGARFIFIHRHPLAVMTSQVRAARSMLDARNPFAAMLAPWYARLYERPLQLAAVRFLDSAIDLWVRLVGLHVVRVSRYFVENIGALPPAEYTSIRYEDLCREPDRTMERILAFAQVKPEAKVRWRDQIQPRPLNAPPEVYRRYRHLRHRLAPYLEFHRYDAEPAALAARPATTVRA